MYVHKHTDENDVEAPTRQIKDAARNNSKDDNSKKATAREFLPVLQPKSANNTRSFGQKPSGLKESRIPLKRTDSNAELDNSKKIKRQQLKSVEKTYRKAESEQEWAPEEPFDLSVFDNKFYDQENIMNQTESFPSLPRRFASNVETKKEKQSLSLPLLSKEKEEVKDVVAVADFSTPPTVDKETELPFVPEDAHLFQSTVEYGPEKEIELPFVPEDAHLFQFNGFTSIADISAYEAKDESEEIELEFEQDEDFYYLQNLFALDNQLEDLLFECPYELVVVDDTIEDDSQSIDVPFHDSLFDLRLVECSN